jgi:hypothetical protein
MPRLPSILVSACVFAASGCVAHQGGPSAATRGDPQSASSRGAAGQGTTAEAPTGFPARCAPSEVQVMLLGTYHFANPGLDEVKQHVDDVLLVGEDDIEQAILMLLEIEKTVVEGAGAVGLAALMKHRARFAGRKVGLILSGGNIEPLVLGEIIQRGMVKSGRLARLRMDVRDVPGALADVATLLGKLGANIDEVQHQRAFSSLSVERAEIEVVVHTRGVAHIEEILAAMRAQGYRAERIG